MTDWSSCPAVERGPKKISGAWTFTGTRVPVHGLFGNLANDVTIDEFVESFPGVDKKQVRAVSGTRSARAKRDAVALKLPGTPAPLRDSFLRILRIRWLRRAGRTGTTASSSMWRNERDTRFSTTEQSLPYQQSLSGRVGAVVLLSTKLARRSPSDKGNVGTSR